MRSPNSSGGETRIRTGGKGFAGPRLTTWHGRMINGAGYGIRTRGLHLGKVARYQLR